MHTMPMYRYRGYLEIHRSAASCHAGAPEESAAPARLHIDGGRGGKRRIVLYCQSCNCFVRYDSVDGDTGLLRALV